MSHNFVGIMFNSHHYTHPFTCPCGEEDVQEQHSLSVGQRVFIVAMSILIAIPTFGVGGILSFYILSAALKARNVVWIDYTAANPSYYQQVSFFQPAYWGFRAAMPRRSYTTYYPTTTYSSTYPVSSGSGYSSSLIHGGSHVPVDSGHSSLGYHGGSHVPVGSGYTASPYTLAGHVPVGTRKVGGRLSYQRPSSLYHPYEPKPPHQSQYGGSTFTSSSFASGRGVSARGANLTGMSCRGRGGGTLGMGGRTVPGSSHLRRR